MSAFLAAGTGGCRWDVQLGEVAKGGSIDCEVEEVGTSGGELGSLMGDLEPSPCAQGSAGFGAVLHLVAAMRAVPWSLERRLAVLAEGALRRLAGAVGTGKVTLVPDGVGRHQDALDGARAYFRGGGVAWVLVAGAALYAAGNARPLAGGAGLGLQGVVLPTAACGFGPGEEMQGC